MAAKATDEDNHFQEEYKGTVGKEAEVRTPQTTSRKKTKSNNTKKDLRGSTNSEHQECCGADAEGQESRLQCQLRPLGGRDHGEQWAQHCTVMMKVVSSQGQDTVCQLGEHVGFRTVETWEGQ